MPQRLEWERERSRCPAPLPWQDDAKGHFQQTGASDETPKNATTGVIELVVHDGEAGVWPLSCYGWAVGYVGFYDFSWVFCIFRGGHLMKFRFVYTWIAFLLVIHSQPCGERRLCSCGDWLNSNSCVGMCLCLLLSFDSVCDGFRGSFSEISPLCNVQNVALKGCHISKCRKPNNENNQILFFRGITAYIWRHRPMRNRNLPTPPSRQATYFFW